VYADPGYLLFHREGTLYAQAFDADDLTLGGEAVRLADGLPYGAGGAAAFAAAHRTALVFRNDPRRQAAATGPAVTTGGAIAGRPLRWITRTGTAVTAAEAAEWSGVDLAPDGTRAAAHRHDSDGGDVWIFQVGQAKPAKLTFEAAQDNASPVWSPDGTRIAFSSQRNGKRGLYVKVADNSRAEELLLESEVPVMPMSWSGDRLVYWAGNQRTAGDVWSVGTSGDMKPMPILQTPADERNPQVSADGKWMAYSSNETGRSEIYIRPFPDGPGKIQVSVNGGVFPRWRRDGRELYFLSLVSLGSMMGSEIRVTGASVQREVPRTLFQTLFVSNLHPRGQAHAFAVSADGQRFLLPQFESVASGFGRGGRGGINAAVASVLVDVGADRRAATGSANQSSAPLTVVLDWTSTLRR
jgi:dipeptidyl aminopeptidase/acylaminoacyl peptidase